MNKRTADIFLGIVSALSFTEFFGSKFGSASHDPTDPQFYNKMIRQSRAALQRKKQEETNWRSQYADLIQRWSNGDQSAWIEISTIPLPYNKYDDIAKNLREYWDFLHLQPSFGMSLQDSMLATFTDKEKMSLIIDAYRNNPEWKSRLISEFDILPPFIDMPRVSILDDFFNLRTITEQNSLAELPKYRDAAISIGHRDRVAPTLKIVKGDKNTLLLDTVAIVKTNFPDADFWIQTRGSADSIGTVHRKFGVNTPGQPAEYGTLKDIGIKVRPEYLGVLDPRYLSYVFEYFKMQGLWIQIGTQGTIMWHIRTNVVKNIPLDFGE